MRVSAWTSFSIDDRHWATRGPSVPQSSSSAIMPGQHFSYALFAAVYGQLGEREAAGNALRELLALKSDFAGIARDQFAKWYPPELVEQLIDGLRKAGLDVPTAEGARAEAGAPAGPEAGDDASSRPSKTARDAAVSIAVLPFSDMSPAKDQEYLCEGMAARPPRRLSSPLLARCPRVKRRQRARPARPSGADGRR